MTAPLTPREADLQDFSFMPLHVARLRDSDLAAEEEPEACWYAVLLWSASWHQLPAGSLPNNDTVLMKLCGLGRDTRTWKKHRAGALRGFVLCDDGRLYHPVVAEQVVEAWTSKLQQRWRTECARIRKANQRSGRDDPQPAYDEFVARDTPEDVTLMSHGTAENVPSDIGSKGQGQGQGQGRIEDDDGGSAGARDPDPDPFPTDLIELTRALCRAGGIRHVDPGPVIRHQQLVRGWLDEGFDAERVILPAIRDAVANATERIGSFQFFDRSVRQYAARQEAAHGNPTRTNRRAGRAYEIDDAARGLGFG